MTGAGARPTTLIFDVEGTLIDCVPLTLACWKATLAEYDHPVSVEQLQTFSGLDGREMLNRLCPDLPSKTKTRILKAQGKRYREVCLAKTRPFPGVQQLFQNLHGQGYRLAIATTCQKDELAYYDKHMDVVKLCSVTVCGSDVKKGKPHPDLFRYVLEKLGLHQHSAAMAIGDTPFDAMAAVAAGVQSLGVLTGGFSQDDLEKAGCGLVLARVGDLADRI